MTNYRKVDEQWGYEDHKKISQLVRKHHFYTSWYNKDKQAILEIAQKIRKDFNKWVGERDGISTAFIRRELPWTDNGGWWEQEEGRYELMQPFADRLEKDWHLMHCLHSNYKKARYEFISLIIGNY